MKTIFDKATSDELVARINKLDENATAQWGNMNIHQMIKHCSLWDEWVLGKNKDHYKQAFIGRLFGKMALKSLTKDDQPLRRNTPTLASLKVTGKSGDVAAEKKNWIALLRDYQNYSNPGFIHSFFGKMTKEQIGILAYKHIDHHLRQFNA
jgi:Protein of unknown function (DUF1569)